MSWFWRDPFNYLYIYDMDEVRVKYVKVTNDIKIIPDGYTISKIGKYHTTYVKNGCYDILYFPVSDINKVVLYLTAKLNQKGLKEIYDRENSFFSRIYNFLNRLFRQNRQLAITY